MQHTQGNIILFTVKKLPDLHLNLFVNLLWEDPKNYRLKGGMSPLRVYRLVCIILHYNMYYFHFTLQEPC